MPSIYRGIGDNLILKFLYLNYKNNLSIHYKSYNSQNKIHNNKWVAIFKIKSSEVS